MENEWKISKGMKLSNSLELMKGTWKKKLRQTVTFSDNIKSKAWGNEFTDKFWIYQNSAGSLNIFS